MKIPVFVSCPTRLSELQEASRKLIDDQLDARRLDPRAIGVSDSPTEPPLREVLVLAKHCSGGVILGFEQLRVYDGIQKYGIQGYETKVKEVTIFPTEWNQLEAGVLYSAGLPLLVFKEQGVKGGIFDFGVADIFVHEMPKPPSSERDKNALTSVFEKWGAKVREHYYR